MPSELLYLPFFRTLRENFTIDVFTYHTLMMGNTKLGRFYRVLALYEEALNSSAQLDGGIFSLAMLAALHSGLAQMVPKIAEQARSQSNPFIFVSPRFKGSIVIFDTDVKLTEASYTTLIQAYAEAGASDQAVLCLDQMLDEGLQPNVISYAATMAGKSRNIMWNLS